mmetsp:Transcript_24664/g.71118  ORF Transcript_24664/g.71118 Transcript_24664/m.71118 type:complete len:262 (+) Transcript_24664:626-1411(+)
MKVVLRIFASSPPLSMNIAPPAESAALFSKRHSETSVFGSLVKMAPPSSAVFRRKSLSATETNGAAMYSAAPLDPVLSSNVVLEKVEFLRESPSLRYTAPPLQGAINGPLHSFRLKLLFSIVKGSSVEIAPPSSAAVLFWKLEVSMEVMTHANRAPPPPEVAWLLINSVESIDRDDSSVSKLPFPSSVQNTAPPLLSALQRTKELEEMTRLPTLREEIPPPLVPKQSVNVQPRMVQRDSESAAWSSRHGVSIGPDSTPSSR